MKALLLDDIKDAVYIAKNRGSFIHDDILVLSTHASVNVFLKEKFQIECTSLCEFLTPAQAARNIKLSDRLTNETVDLLDDAHSGPINEKAGLKGIKFFRALYSYPIYYQLIIFLNLYEALKEAVKREGIGEILFFDKKINKYYGSEITVQDALKVFSGMKLTPVLNDAAIQAKPENAGALRWHKTIRYPSLTLLSLLSRFERFVLKLKCSNIVKGRKTIMVFEPLYDLSFLHRHLALSGFNILPHNFDFKVTADMGVRSVRDHAISDISEGVENGNGTRYQSHFKYISIKDAEKTFSNNSGRYLGYLKELDRLNNMYDIRLGVWGVSPTYGLAGLASEYLLKNNKPVIGMQHGGLLGNLHNGDVCLTEMSRCSDYISYGFDKNDLKKTYPEKKVDNVTIHEFGTTKTNKKRTGKKPAIRLLFPLTNTLSMLEGGMMRDMPDTILDNQLKLIGYLDSVTGRSIVIKPFPFSDRSSLAILPVLEKTKRIKVINNLSFKDTINSYDVNAVLFEYATTTLYEALAYDMEIFLVNNNEVTPIEESALEELKKRVHYAENADDIIPMLELFFNGKLEKKRDDTFYNHYVRKEDTKQNILELVEKLAGS